MDPQCPHKSQAQGQMSVKPTFQRGMDRRNIMACWTVGGLGKDFRLYILKGHNSSHQSKEANPTKTESRMALAKRWRKFSDDGMMGEH